MKKITTSIVLFVIAAVFSLTLSAFAEDWPMFHHDVALSGYTNSHAPDTNYILWTYQTDSSVYSSPAVVNGKVYIGSLDGYLYCLNRYTGALIWKYQTGGMVQSSPAVSDGKVYVLSSNGTFYALDANSGSLIWSSVIGPGPWDWSSPAVHDGNVFVASSTGWLYSFNANTGLFNWMSLIGGSPDSPIAVVNGKVYSGTHNFDNSSPTLVAADESTGAILWTYYYFLFHANIVGMVNSNGAAVVDGDGDGNLEVYFGVFNWEGVNNQAVCLNETNGQELWTKNINGDSTSTPAVHGGKMFIGSDDGKLYSLDASTGSELCSYQTGDQVWSAPALSGDGKVCFGSLDHTVYCLDAATCNLVWSYYTGASRLISSPAISDGNLFIGNENGKVYAFGPMPVTIDIKPYSYPNSINLKNKGNVPVAVLSNPYFDATMLDRSTVEFAGANPLPIGMSPQDVNGDGLLDIVLHFKTQELNLKVGDTEACLSGETYGGMMFKGCDSVRIVK